MLRGSGIDILRADRFRNLKNTLEFINNVFTPQELAQSSAFSRRDTSYSAFFTLKEAILKALGIGLHQGSFWKQIEVDRRLSPRINQTLFDLTAGQPIKKVHVSVAQTKEYTLSVALAETEE